MVSHPVMNKRNLASLVIAYLLQFWVTDKMKNSSYVYVKRLPTFVRNCFFLALN
jgi:hypothetical protein